MLAVSLLLGVVTLGAVLGVLGYLSFQTARGSGWRTVAETHAARHVPEDAPTLVVSATFNGYAFTKTLLVAPTKDGLFLRPVLPLRAFHPPLLLPWAELSGELWRRRGEQGLRVDLRNGPPCLLETSEATRRRLVEAASATKAALDVFCPSEKNGDP